MLNKSNIGYDIDFLKFTVRDQKLVKRTAKQESELAPRNIYNGQLSAILGQQQLERVYVVPKFTIPDDKVLLVELFEKGERASSIAQDYQPGYFAGAGAPRRAGNGGHALAWPGRAVDHLPPNA